MDEIKNMLITMQEEMRQQKADMLDMKEDIKNTIISTVNEKFNSLELKNQYLEQQLELLESKINNMERFMRKKNILFFGVEERERSYQDLQNKVLDILNNMLVIKCNEHGIESLRRLGKKGDKPRPIVVTLATMGLKIKILKTKEKLETSSYYVKEDFPPEILNKRKELKIELIKERQLGNRAIIKYDKLIILDTKIKQNEDSIPNSQSSHEEKDNKNLSESPETAPRSSNNSIKKQYKKLSKNSYLNNYFIKKPSLMSQETPSPQKAAPDLSQTILYSKQRAPLSTSTSQDGWSPRESQTKTLQS